ncbi:MAG: sulfatase-like hydrolase/transferase [Candidatus Aminicenantes bacterium]|nr:sulfatase-like hydrolase/transferase [Candidatus Aminicenantes bacterium]
MSSKRAIDSFFKFLVTLGISGLISLGLGSGTSSSPRQLNVLLITIDTLRADHLGVYGGPSNLTPEIDRWAAGGVIFNRAFAHATTTLPAHASILLGATPLYHGVHENGTFYVQENYISLAEHLQSAGWSTAAFVGAYPLDARFGLDQGFEIYDDQYGSQDFDHHDYVERPAEAVIDRALAWVKSASQPWFLWIHCYDPHAPYEPPPPYNQLYQASPYKGEVAYVSTQVGRLHDWLTKQNLEDKTIVILTGDHGEGLGDHGERTHGYFAYNSTLWVPLIISSPGSKHHRVENYVSHQDIFPTVCDLLDLKVPRQVQGQSLRPALQGKKIKERTIYFESLYPYYSRGWAPLRGLIINHHKYIDSPIPELYDLEADFREEKNLITSSSWTHWKEKLDEFQKKNRYPQAEKAYSQELTPEIYRRLKSLGYVSSGRRPQALPISPATDIKTMLFYENQVEDAWRLAQAGQVEKALKLLKQVRDKKPELDIAYTRLASLYKQQGLTQKALEILETGRERLPSNYEIFSAYVSLLLELGHFGEVIQAIKSSSLRPLQFDPEMWNYLGVAYGHLGEFEEAIKAYDLALKLDPDYPVAAANRGLAAALLYRRSRQRDWFNEAERSFRLALEADENLVSAYNGLAFLYQLNGDYSRAIDEWEKAVQIDPHFGLALYNLGLAYLHQGRKDKALTCFLNYKKQFFNSLTQEEKIKLEELINQCQQK